MLDRMMDRSRTNERVLKRGPGERPSAGWNLWCYLFCGLIAAFSHSNFIHSKGRFFSPSLSEIND